MPDGHDHNLTRRQALGLLGAGGLYATAGPLPEPPAAPTSLVARNDAAVAALLEQQLTAGEPRWIGSVPDAFDLHGAGGAGGLVETLTASFVHAESRYHRDPVPMNRIRLAAAFLERCQSPQGNIDLLTTNFNSPPDTGFVVHNVATAARVAQLHDAPAIVAALKPFLIKAGDGLAAGGVHTPNHRWVISSALAQIHELFPDPRYVPRIEQWLAEGIDIDADGQFTERSTLTYNVVTDRALLVMAVKLKRPELLEPVRRNLDTLRYLLHADGEVVTEISRRQDQYTRGGVAGYWFPATYLAIAGNDAELAALARQAADGARLSTLLEYPELSRPLPLAGALPDDYERVFPAIGLARIRRQQASSTVVLDGASRFLSFRRGRAVVEGIRFATSFFGKGQFVPDHGAKNGAAYVLRQTLEAPYYQPLDRRITPETWPATRPERRQSEVARLDQSAAITERAGGWRVRIQATGTSGVPLAIEITFRDGGSLRGCVPLDGAASMSLLPGGRGEYRAGSDAIRFGPGQAAHRYLQLRGAEVKLPGTTVYVTGYTPFDHTLDFDWT